LTKREYMDRTIELFKSGAATEDQWEELAQALVFVSEMKYLLPDYTSLLWAIDEVVEFDEREEEMEINH